MSQDTRAFGQQLDPETEQRIEEIVAEMTIEEAVGQVIGSPPLAGTDALKRDLEEHHLGSIHFGGTPYNISESKARLAKAAQEITIEPSRFDVPLFLRAMVEHGHAVAGSTVFPQQLGLAATRDPALVERCAAVTVRELRATGVQSTSSPIGDVTCDGGKGESGPRKPLARDRLSARTVRSHLSNRWQNGM